MSLPAAQSMRGVPMIDASGIHALEHLWHAQAAVGGMAFICGAQPQVRRMLERFGLVALFGEESFYWDTGAAIAAAHPPPRSDRVAGSVATEGRT